MGSTGSRTPRERAKEEKRTGAKAARSEGRLAHGRRSLFVSRLRPLLARGARLGVVGACFLVAIVFYILEPDAFSDLNTWRGILDQAAIPAIVAMGLTVALIVGDFDLSIGATMGLAMGVAVSLMANNDIGWVLAAAITIGVGAVVGLVNGGVVAGLRVNSFIATLATSSIILGIEARITDQATIVEGIPLGFQQLGEGRWLFDMTTIFWVAVGIGALLWAAMAHSETGRYMYATGGNPEAARLAGVRTSKLRILGFIVTGMCAALAGVLLAATSVSYYPSAGTGYLLPAFAGAFLGTAVSGGRFSILATAFAVFFLELLRTGLTIMNIDTWVVLVVQGSVLVLAVVVGSAEGRARITQRWPRRKTPRHDPDSSKPTDSLSTASESQ